jgi:hypothetical protein
MGITLKVVPILCGVEKLSILRNVHYIFVYIKLGGVSFIFQKTLSKNFPLLHIRV